jgi:hypothetical protein
MKSVPRYWRLVLAIGPLTILLMSVWMGCTRERQSAATSDSLPQLDKNCRPGQPPTTRDELEACKTGLAFDEEELVGDRQRLMVFDPGSGTGCPGARTIQNCRLGPLARIQPEVHSHLWPETTVAREGRIIAQLSLADGERQGYPKLALVPGHTTYWWVQIGMDGREGRSFYVSDSVKTDGTLYTVEHKGLNVQRYRTGSLRQAIARWLWLADDETTKGSCTASSSCK